MAVAAGFEPAMTRRNDLPSRFSPLTLRDNWWTRRESNPRPRSVHIQESTRLVIIYRSTTTYPVFPRRVRGLSLSQPKSVLGSGRDDGAAAEQPTNYLVGSLLIVDFILAIDQPVRASEDTSNPVETISRPLQLMFLSHIYFYYFD